MKKKKKLNIKILGPNMQIEKCGTGYYEFSSSILLLMSLDNNMDQCSLAKNLVHCFFPKSLLCCNAFISNLKHGREKALN